MTVPEVTEGRILIVDDDESQMETLIVALSEEYDILVATNGEEALAVAQADRPDLILLDIVMPEMDGYEVCQRLRGDERTKDIPIIFITVMTDVNHEQKGLDLGVADYIRIPFSPAIVKARVRNHLRLRAAYLELQRMNRQLTEAAEFREQVEQITCHDLKNPLTSILTFPRLIIDQGGLTEKQKAWMEYIEGAGLRMLEQINSSLDLFRIERGLYELPLDDVDLLKTVRNTMRDQFASCHGKGQQIDLRVDGRPAQPDDRMVVQGEELLLYSLVANLLKNAYQAAPFGATISVSFDTKRRSMELRNPGEVPPEIRDRFFDKLVTGGKPGGHGIGTYSARLITELHGGRIEVGFSEPGHTTVTCHFPVA